MTNFSRGDVVIVDLGMAAKVRPCVVVSVSRPDAQRNMSVVAPMTTEIRGGECEVSFPKPACVRAGLAKRRVGGECFGNRRSGQWENNSTDRTVSTEEHG